MDETTLPQGTNEETRDVPLSINELIEEVEDQIRVLKNGRNLLSVEFDRLDPNIRPQMIELRQQEVQALRNLGPTGSGEESSKIQDDFAKKRNVLIAPFDSAEEPEP